MTCPPPDCPPNRKQEGMSLQDAGVCFPLVELQMVRLPNPVLRLRLAWQAVQANVVPTFLCEPADLASDLL